MATWLRFFQLRDCCSIPGKSKRLFSSLRQSKLAPNLPTFPFSVYWFIGGFSKGLKYPGVKVTTHFHLVQRFRMRRVLLVWRSKETFCVYL